MTPALIRRLAALCAGLLLSTCLLAQSADGGTEREALREIQLGSESFTRGDPVPAWVRRVAVPATTLRAPVVLRLADTQFRVAAVPEVFVERALQVNDSAALARIGQFPIHFVPQYQKVRLHAVRVLRGEQVLERTASTQIRFLQREAGLENGIYSGTVTASLLIEDVRVGDTLSIAYSTEGANPVFGPLFFDAASWDGSEPIEWRRVTLLHPPERSIQWRMVGDFRTAQPRPETGTEQGMRLLRFEERGVQALYGEPYIPDSYMAWRYLQFSEYRDWQQVARWAEGLFPARPPLPPEAQALVQRLRALPSAEDRVLEALRWVQREIRYFSVSMGESSHRPHDPQWVVQRRYGDCKDKTYLLVSLLRELGIEADPMLVSLQSRRLPARLLPSPDAFDHAIVRVRLNGRSHYLDGTRPVQAAGRLDSIGLALEGGFALVVAPDTTALLELSSPQSLQLATHELSERIVLPRLAPEGTLELRQTFRGAAAEGWRLGWARSTPEQRRKAVLSWYERSYPGSEVDGEPVVRDDLQANVFVLEARLKVPKLAQNVNGDWVVRFSPAVLRGLFNLPQTLQRNFPAETLPFPYRGRYALVMQWPENVAVVTDPSTRRVSGPSFDAEIARSFRGARFEYTLGIDTKAAVTAVRDLPRLMEDVKRLDDAVMGVAVVERKAVKDSGFLGFGADTVQSSMRKRMEDVVSRTSATIATGRLKGEDLAEVLCTRAEALADLGRGAEGLVDAADAVKAAATTPRALMCRGNLYFNTGDFARAIPDYTRALGLGQPPSEALYHRALARFYGEQVARAAEDFAQAAADDTRNLYPTMWRIWALQRSGQALPAEVAELARRDPRGAWPRPALALQVGAISVDDLLAIAQRMQGDERELNMTEALFAIGQWHLVNGRTGMARESFEAARAKGITMFIEHVAAGFELARLPK